MPKKTELVVCKEIFEVLTLRDKPIYKSDLRKAPTRLGARSINHWINLISFIQKQPILKLEKKGNREILRL